MLADFSTEDSDSNKEDNNNNDSEPEMSVDNDLDRGHGGVVVPSHLPWVRPGSHGFKPLPPTPDGLHVDTIRIQSLSTSSNQHNEVVGRVRGM